jgi:hypothetical protein
MPGLMSLIWKPSTEVLFRDVAGAKQLCSEFRFQITPAPGYAGEAGFITFDKASRVTVYPGYAWDGASGPTIDTLDSVCAALGHDVLYELMRLGKLPIYLYKDAADLWFYNRLRKDGMFDYRAWAWYCAVRRFGGPGTLPENHPPIKRAPIPFPVRSRASMEIIPGYRVPA